MICPNFTCSAVIRAGVTDTSHPYTWCCTNGQCHTNTTTHPLLRHTGHNHTNHRYLHTLIYTAVISHRLKGHTVTKPHHRDTQNLSHIVIDSLHQHSQMLRTDTSHIYLGVTHNYWHSTLANSVLSSHNSTFTLETHSYTHTGKDIPHPHNKTDTTAMYTAVSLHRHTQLPMVPHKVITPRNHTFTLETCYHNPYTHAHRTVTTILTPARTRHMVIRTEPGHKQYYPQSHSHPPRKSTQYHTWLQKLQPDTHPGNRRAQLYTHRFPITATKIHSKSASSAH